MKVGFNQKQLKLIAILSMVIDHFAWGFVDFYSLPGQILHILGRFTIPIMCFFIAEGYRKTSNLKKYIGRMVFFWLFSIIPFYLFFHEEYEYRQNIIFDLLLGLLVLTVANHKNFKKWQKTILISGIVVVSMVIGGWPVMPIIYICIFYYGKDFKQQAKWFCSATVGLVLFMCVSIYLNQIYHFSHYDWVWYEKFYFLGFMLALPLLKRYNGELSKLPLPRYFFYFFYPGHFLVLYAFQIANNYLGLYGVYVTIHIMALLIVIMMLAYVLQSKPSRAQNALAFLISFSIMYMVGFLLEITTSDLDVLCAAVKIEYFGECMLFVGITWFLADFLHLHVRKEIYYVEVCISFVAVLCVFTMEYHTWFYKSISINTDGPFSRLELEYGVGFYLLMAYLAVVCIAFFIAGVRNLKNCFGLERKRILWILPGLFLPWIVTGLRAFGLTGGYEMTSLGIIGIGACFEIGLIHYGFFDSEQAALTNTIARRHEAIMIINLRHRITYVNDFMLELFPDMEEGMDAYQNEVLKDIFVNKGKYREFGKKVYQMNVEQILEKGYVQGYMLWTTDVTEHVENMRRIESLAQKDALTGLFNRKYYQEAIDEVLRNDKNGAMMMIDVDDFKHVNDTYGHAVGDKVLRAIGQSILKISNYSITPCRIGGDEFNIFIGDVVDEMNLERIAQTIIKNLALEIKENSLPAEVTLSIGIVSTDMIDRTDNRNFATMYADSDKALYLAKNRGKNQYQIFK